MNIRFFVFLLLLLTSSCSRTQSPLTLDKGSITDELHQEHIGKITFMNGYVPYEEYGTSSMLSSFDLSEESNLNMRVFLGHTLTHYLNQLAPDLKVRDLCDEGNYQFRFYVDGSMVYEENLNTGAGSCEQKNSSTIFSVPLASTEQEDSWGRFLWMRFLFRGGGDAALSTAGRHVLEIEIRPYIDLGELKIGDVLARGRLDLNVVRPSASEEEIAIQLIEPGSDWETSSDAFDEELIQILNQKTIERDFRDITSIAIIKEGKLLLEEYFNGADRSTLHDPRSVGKTFASTMMGIAIDEGYISNEEARLSDFYNLKSYSNYSPSKERVTLKSLLMMSSGFDADDNDYDSPGNEEYMYPTNDWVKFALDLKMDDDKTMGEDWAYFTAGVVVLGDIINTSVPGGLEKYADDKLFKPLGIADRHWQYTPTEVPNTAGGLQLRTLDFAKFGQLYKNEGRWNGAQVVPKDWAIASLSPQVSRGDEEGGYGYLFWNDQYEVDGQSYEVSYCTGNGGNKIYIFKDIPYVIVVTATAYGRPYAHPQVDKMMEEYILPAVLR